MEIQAQATSSTPRREPWNKGKLIGQKPPLQGSPNLAPSGGRPLLHWIHRFAIDSPLEEDGFELAVPPRRERLWAATPGSIAVSDLNL
jgi:hypothetical protein